MSARVPLAVQVAAGVIGVVVAGAVLRPREPEAIAPEDLPLSPSWPAPDAGLTDPLEPDALPRVGGYDSGRYDNQIRYAAELNGLTDALAPVLIKAIIAHESGWNTRALGDAGCSKGLMQVNGCAHPQLDLARGGAYDLFEPNQNILAGCQLLAVEYRRYWPEWERVLVGYNGPALARSGVSSNAYSRAVARFFVAAAAAAGYTV